MARKEQKLIFTISKTASGQMLVNMSFFPRMVTKDEFEKLPMERKEMQCMAGDIGKFVMQRLAQLRDGKFTGAEGETDENASADQTGT